MSDPTDVQNSIERMMSRMDLRGLRPNTVPTFAGCALRFLAQVGKAPSVVTAGSVVFPKATASTDHSHGSRKAIA